MNFNLMSQPWRNAVINDSSRSIHFSFVAFSVNIKARQSSGMSVSVVARSTFTRDVSRSASSKLSRVFPRSIRSQPFSICRRHEAQIRARKSEIRSHIQALEQSRRRFSTSPRSLHGHIDPPEPGEERHVTFIDKDGHESTFEVADGDNLLDIAQANDLEMEGTCAVYTSELD